jgi:DHA3 family macrolide efflux protein-like MFS transporter
MAHLAFAVFIAGQFCSRLTSTAVLVACCMLGGGLLPSNQFALFVLVFSIAGVGSALYNSAATTLIQLAIPQEYLGRVFALYNSIMLLAMPLAMSWGGVVAQLFGPSRVYLISGILMIPAGLVLLLPRSVRALGRQYKSTADIKG